MLKKFSVAVCACVLGAGLVATPLMAEPLSVEGRVLDREHVSYRDLDLRQWNDQVRLKTRVRHASKRLCQTAEPMPTYGFGPSAAASKTCKDLTYDATRPQIAAAIDQAKSGRPVMALAMVITLPGRTR